MSDSVQIARMSKEEVEAAAPYEHELEDDGRIPVTARLTERHHAYLAARAASFGHTPEQHLELILREFRSLHDSHRPEHQAAPMRGGPPVTGRR